jgi:hypothetical protein
MKIGGGSNIKIIGGDGEISEIKGLASLSGIEAAI